MHCGAKAGYWVVPFEVCQHFFAWRCFLEKQRWTCKKQDLKPLMAGNMAFCFIGKTYPTIESFRLVFEFLCLVCHHLIHMYPAELCKLSESKKPTERPRPGHGLSSVHQVSCCNANPFAKWSRFLPLGKRHSAELPLLLGSLIGKPMSWALNLTGDASKRWIPTTFSTSNHDWYWAWSAQHIQ